MKDNGDNGVVFSSFLCENDYLMCCYVEYHVIVMQKSHTSCPLSFLLFNLSASPFSSRLINENSEVYDYIKKKVSRLH